MLFASFAADFAKKRVFPKIPESVRPGFERVARTVGVKKLELGVRREGPVSSDERLNYAKLNDQVFTVRGDVNFEQMTRWMDDRFEGLPLFHRSVHLDIKRVEKVVVGETGAFNLPDSVYARTDSRLLPDLRKLLATLEREPGVRSFGLLHLGVKLSPGKIRKNLRAREILSRSILKDIPAPAEQVLDRLVQTLGESIEVPVLLAVGSRRTESHYESLAAGLSGVTRYCSALTVRETEPGVFRINGGLEVEVLPEHINHPSGLLLELSQGLVLDPGFFNRYLKAYLEPERERIVKRLCEYVFNGCRFPKGRKRRASVTVGEPS